ncbi:MAG: acetyl-CoA carboxylase carboxyltransferase subunit alpha [Oscillospiraceae bacterium]|nr:acetyl-CoA carboxylase carboxyltransferase subunit alpha [Oscillospiraceae bacterium]
MTAFEKVRAARSNSRPTAADYIENICTDYIELHGDRRFGDDGAIIGGIAKLNGMPVTVIGIEKGRNIKERIQHSFGAPNPEGYRKALRLMKQAEKFHRPVICFVDTSGAFCGIGAEERGQGLAIAECLMEMMSLRTPEISIIIGEGGSGGALALSVSDRVWMLENAIYSVISPEGCASILWKDSAKAAAAADCLKLTAQDSFENGLIDDIIEEQHLGKDEFFTGVREKLANSLDRLRKLDTEELLENRYMRFRRIGRTGPEAAE